MDGITDHAMRELQGQIGCFSYAVSEFVRVSQQALPRKVFTRKVPEVAEGCKTRTGLSVQIQILGGHPSRMQDTAYNAVRAGARAIDINFGCPAKTVNRNDGGATLLHYPERIFEICRAIRSSVDEKIPISAKLRLGWESIDPIFENARAVQEAGLEWITIHARTRLQGYSPPVFWSQVGTVAQGLSIPVVANGDIWNLSDFWRCRAETGLRNFMIGRGALANPLLSWQISKELGLLNEIPMLGNWLSLFQSLDLIHKQDPQYSPKRSLLRIKQWMKLAHLHGDFPNFDQVKRIESLSELFDHLSTLSELHKEEVPCR